MLKQPDKRNTVAVVIGAGRRNGDHENMAITATDAVRVKDALVDFCPFLEENCYCLTNRSAAKDQIIKQLKQLAASNGTKRSELVVIYISAHGCIKDGEFYIVCNDTLDYDIPRTALSGKELLELLDEINTDKLLLLLDCCHANGIHMPAAMIFDKAAFLQKPNRLVLAASHANEAAYLSSPVSIFTFALIEGLGGTHFKGNDTNVDVLNLSMYVRERVFLLSRSRQSPQLHVLHHSNTTNFIITTHPAGKIEYVFREPITLLDEGGKAIPLGDAIERDIEYRRQFNWLNITNYNQEDNSEIIDNSINIGGDLVLNVFNDYDHDIGSGQLILPAMPDSSSIVDIILLKNNELLLIERAKVKNRLEKMFIDDKGGVLILDGSPETGLSHLSYLFSEIAEKYGYYEYRYINIRDLSKVYPGKMIGPWLIAKAIFSKIGADFTIVEDKFDLYDFLKILRTELAEHARQHRRFFFYFDQFNVKCTSDLSVFMMELVKLVCVENMKMFIAIGGYKEVDLWHKDIKRMVNPLMIGQYFTRDAVNSFLKKLYNHEANKFYERMNWETFLESTRPYLLDSLFETPSIPNISAVGDALWKWFLSIRNNL